MNKVFIADPALKDHRGHHYNLTQNIAENCQKLGMTAIWLTSKGFSPSNGERDRWNIRQTFSTDTYDGFRAAQSETAHLDGPITQSAQPRAKKIVLAAYRCIPTKVRAHITPLLRRAIDRVRDTGRSIKSVRSETPSHSAEVSSTPEQELFQAISAHGFSSDDLVLFHTCDGHTYRDILRLFSTVVPVTLWNTMPVFHLSTPYDEQIMPHNKEASDCAASVRRMDSIGLIGTRIHLHAENELLAAHLKERLKVDVTPLPIPPISTHIDKKYSKLLKVAHLGPARVEKGFLDIPDLVDQVLASDLAESIHFTIQITAQILGYPPEVKQAVDRLKSIDSTNLTLIEEPLGQSEYLRTLAETDVMLMCYKPDRYAMRSSGIAVESVLSAITIVATKGTFPAYLAGESGIAIQDPGDVYTGLCDILSARTKFMELSQSRRQWYMEHNGVECFKKALSLPGKKVQVSIVLDKPRYSDQTPWLPLIGRDSSC